MSGHQILLLTTGLADQVDHYRKSLEAANLKSDDPIMLCIRLALQPTLAALLPWIIEDLNKVHEINYAAKHTDLQLNPTNKGPDLFARETGAAIEHKYSTLKQVSVASKVDGSVKKTDTFKCNVNFELPVHMDDVAARLVKLKEKVDTKVSGYMSITVAGRNPMDVSDYHVGRDFLLEYLTQYMAKKPKAVRANLGGAVCHACGEVHRLRDMVTASKETTPENKSEVVKVFLSKRIASQCKQ